MPFTLAHPAASVPFQRALGRYGSLGGLVIGSMAPDIAYFIPLGVARAQSHSLSGLFWFCLPAGVLAFLAFYLVVAPLVYDAAPNRIRAVLPARWGLGSLPASSAIAVAASLMLGAITHLIWDSFTHGNGAAVEALPGLATLLTSVGGYDVFIYKVLQHGSSLLGMALLAWWAIRGAGSSTKSGSGAGELNTGRPMLAALVLLPPLLVGLVAGVDSAATGEGMVDQLRRFLSAGVFTGGSTLVALILLVGVVWRVVRTRVVR